MELIGLKKCSTCKAVEKQLNEQHLAYSYREINVDNPSAQELSAWYQKSEATTPKKFVNTSGLKYKALGLKDKWDTLSESEQFELLATDGMLVKRPILILDNGQVLVGREVSNYLTAHKEGIK